ncbi:MAG TPA: sigma-70 family RNA polymerase sigma factor [Bryobacteraceae bacterium]|nr:sigma-70 family RNA polymerase sigma factor [Bryobacteraceae bacterium]
MQRDRSGEITVLLHAWRSGDRQAIEDLTPLIYGELRRLARFHMRRERGDHTLGATGLVHEAFLRLLDECRVSYRDRLHFFGAAAGVMRRVLVDHARARRTSKRGGEAIRVTLDEALDVPGGPPDLLLIDDCLRRLSALYERQGRIVELRFFGGLSIEETSELLSISPMTVKREWSVARAWLFREMGGSDAKSHRAKNPIGRAEE